MKKTNQMILVSNPGKQYTHQLLNALQKSNYSYKFITTVWYKPDKFPYTFVNLLPKSLRKRIENQFLKRYEETVVSDHVIQYPNFELIREVSDKLFGQRFAERMQFFRDRFHDKNASSRLKSLNPEIVIGYEESCLETFREAKKRGITTVLDLAQIHYQEIISISNQFPNFKELYKNSTLREKINKIKEEELSLADHIICLSEWAKESLIKNNISANKIHVANLGYDPYKFEAKVNYSSKGKLKILFVGTLTKRKGIDLLIKISQELSNIVELNLVGPMADADQLLKSKKKYFTWHPYADHNELSKLYKEVDLFVFPSYLDSWGMVVVEAMASGLPVIVSDNTGSKEAIRNNSGFVVPTGDLTALKEKIILFHYNKSLLEEMGRNARKESLEHTWNTYHAKINQIIKDIRSNEKER